MEHDALCLTQYPYHRPCNCEYVLKVRADERQVIAAYLWRHIQPLTSFVAGVNMSALPVDNEPDPDHG